MRVEASHIRDNIGKTSFGNTNAMVCGGVNTRIGSGVIVAINIYRILVNPIYIGMVRHKDAVYDGEQKGIIDRALWDKVQYLLRENSNCEPGARRNATESPFKGLLVCGYCGCAFCITYSHKKSRRYMYYVCIKDHVRAERECPVGILSA